MPSNPTMLFATMAGKSPEEAKFFWSGGPRSDLATAVADLAGGALALAMIATEKATNGDLSVACHLADFALEADPSDIATREAVAAIYDRRAESETSLMAVNLMNSAAAYARNGRPFI